MLPSTRPSLLRLEALPASTDLALLALRVALGATMAFAHGLGKVQRILAGSREFGDPIGIGAVPSLFLTAGAEFFGSLLLLIGLGTRWAALVLAFTMAVAFVRVHHGALVGEGNGETAFLFLCGYVVILIGGPGRFSVDAALKRRD